MARLRKFITRYRIVQYFITELAISPYVFLHNTGRVWRTGRVDAFRPKGHGFDSRFSHHVVTLGKSFTHSCLWRIGVKFRHSIRAVPEAPLSSKWTLRGAIEISSM